MQLSRLSCLLSGVILLGALPLSVSGEAFALPIDAKAQKTFAEAQQKEHEKKRLEALDLYKKADKQEGHHCAACAEEVITLAIASGDYKLATEYATELVSLSKTPLETATAHAYRGMAEVRLGTQEHKQPLFASAHEEFLAAMQARPNDRTVLYFDGLALANLSQDDPARERFQAYLKIAKAESVEGRRALRYIREPGLVRQRMAPAFEVTTIDGKRLSLDELEGKVVLIDFWATWCGPCREALPHVQHIAQKFAGQPLVVLSVSLDTDEQKWRSFVASNHMTWEQTLDGGWNGTMAHQFSVRAIPQTFTIDANGVLQDQHIGDADIEGKLKKLVAQAQQTKPAGAAVEEARTAAQ